MQNVRAAAGLSLTAVIRDGKAFTGALDDPALTALEPGEYSEAKLASRDRALYRELCFGTLRHYFLLDAFLAPLLRKPLGKKDSDVKMLLLLGLYQIIFLRIPDHAALSATVDACKTLKKPWAKGLVNAVLRKFLRDTEAVEYATARSKTGGAIQANGPAGDKESTQDNAVQSLPALCKSLPALCEVMQVKSQAARLSHPDWLLAQLQRDWPGSWQQIVTYNNSPPPMCLRINTARHSRKHYQQLLAQYGIDSQPCAFTKTGLVLARAVDVTALPGFDQGWSSVQDSGAQLAADLLNANPAERVLDACAAPGGKAAHLLQQMPQHGKNVQLTALDISAQRLERVRSNIERCCIREQNVDDLSAITIAIPEQLQLLCADTAEVASWWDGVQFDKILLDAPCSGSGIISHHPDIKLLRHAADINKFAGQQLRLLIALWPTLATGGSLLYCTCSIMPAENASLVTRFLSTMEDAELIPLNAPWGIDTGAGHQLLPNTGKNGGFFYAKLSKRAANLSDAPGTIY